jgi:hypothetical protein
MSLSEEAYLVHHPEKCCFNRARQSAKVWSDVKFRRDPTAVRELFGIVV